MSLTIKPEKGSIMDWIEEYEKSLDKKPEIEPKIRKKRTKIPFGLQKRIMARSRGKCENCGTLLFNIKFDFHHKNYDPSDPRESNLMVICKKCHVKLTGPVPKKKL
ncbi:MAG: HNH endonuclease [Candidatus Aenigmarchaeota archaeon]|nr:HNH endonuclease [Candidatus Aenigmarchaeota archaeon]